MNPLSWFGNVRLSWIVDIAIMTVLIYGVLVWLKRTRRATFILTGILIVAALYLAALWFDLYLTTSVLQGFFAVFLLALVVIFQEELRHLFERIATWSLDRRLPKLGRTADRPRASEVDVLVNTVFALAQRRIGALIVLRGRDPVSRHLEGGRELDGALSEAILQSIFDPHSDGHDGAVIVREGRIHRFGCHLPLSTRHEALGGGGTRHAAALGLTERTDALCLVVSEERGVVSVARLGLLSAVADAGELRRALDEFHREVAPARRRRPLLDRLRRNVRERIAALALALGLWFVLVHGSQPVYRTFVAPVEVTQLPAGFALESFEPRDVHVTLSGPRRAFYLMRSDHVRVVTRAWDVRPGRSRIQLSASDLTMPRNLELEKLEPRTIVVIVRRREPDAPGS